MKNFFDSEAWKWIKVIIKLLLIAAIIYACITVYNDFGFARADEALYTEAWVLCMPDNYVNMRMGPSRKSAECGWKSVGDRVYLDGKKKNGYLRCVDSFGEVEGWIHAGYIVYDEPEQLVQYATIVSRGRLAARKCVGGTRTRWLKPLATVLVYYWSDEWCLTNCGYVKSQYLELEGN